MHTPTHPFSEINMSHLDLPMDDIVVMEILHSLQDLPRVASEHSLIKGSEPGQDAGDGTTRNKLHEDAHCVVFKTRAQVPGENQ